jgi:hypothetical protein
MAPQQYLKPSVMERQNDNIILSWYSSLILEIRRVPMPDPVPPPKERNLGILLVKQICHPIIHKAKPHSRMHANVKRQNQSKKKDIVAKDFRLCKEIILQQLDGI